MVAEDRIHILGNGLVRLRDVSATIQSSNPTELAVASAKTRQSKDAPSRARSLDQYEPAGFLVFEVSFLLLLLQLRHPRRSVQTGRGRAGPLQPTSSMS